MKRLYSSSLLLLLCSLLHAQTLDWSALSSGVGGNVYAMTFFNGNMIAAGSFTTAGSSPANHIASWDGNTWSTLGTGTSGSVRAMTLYHNQLYVAGSFTSAGGVSASKIARWNGVAWDSVGHGITGSNVYALEVYHDKLYAAGRFTMAGTTAANNIAVWNDTAWSAVGAGIQSAFYQPVAYALTTFHDSLFVGGVFDIAGTDSTSFSIAKCDGQNWSHVGLGFDYQVNCLQALGSVLYAGGDFYQSGFQTTNYFAQWSGGQWTGVNNGADYIVNAMVHYGTDIYVVGSFWNIGNVLCYGTARFDGTNFYALGSGVDNDVFAVCADEGIVYAGGLFTHAGSLSVSHIAKWSEIGMGTNEIGANTYSFSTFPNPSKGIFNLHCDGFSDNETIEIYNSMGEKINSFAIKNKDSQIDLSAEARGIYFVREISDGKIIAQSKIILE